MTLDRAYEVYGKAGVFVIAERDGPVVGAFYTPTDLGPGWWRGHVFGKVRRFFLPGAEPVDVAARFMHSR